MPLSPAPAALLQELLTARGQHQALVATPERAAAVADEETAFQLQHATGVALGAWAEADMPRLWKSGGPSRDAALIHAPLLPEGVRHSVAGQAAPLGDLPFFQRGIEAEIALRLGRDVTPALAATLDAGGVDALIDAMAVSIEVVDSRFADLAATPALLKLADFQVHGALVLGAWTPWRTVDWAAQRCSQQIGDAPARQVQGSHTLGTPQWGLPAWLRVLTRHGSTVPAGTIVTTGSWTGMTRAQPGQAVRVVFEGIGKAALQL